MRIVIDIRTISDHFPGIGRYVYDLVRSLSRQVRREELILLSNPALRNTRFDIRSLESDSKIRIQPTAANPFSLREQLLLPIELKALKPDVTHFPYPVLPYAAARPVVVNVHDIIPIRLPRYFSLRHRALYRISLRLAVRSAKWVLCPSEATIRDVQSALHLHDARLIKVPGGIGESFRPRTTSEVASVKAAYGLPESYLLYVGSNKPHKNLPALIDAYARLRGAPPLALAGENDSRYPETRRKVEALHLEGRIRFLGAVRESDLPALYSGALAFIFPSRYEGFGFPPLEAMACGAPVACSDIACLLETTGDAALHFNPEEVQSIAAAMERLLEDAALREDLRARGLRMAAGLSWEQAARQMVEIYRRAAAD
jgi:alpha-1,3-rhamnosyl/mannosyltransferase